jgi:L-threonylcarbamoyladenylate synthase
LLWGGEVILNTLIVKVDGEHPELNKSDIAKAADIIKNGGLVAFPTETVYGLGGNALDGAASQKIYSAKGRPSDNPLIAHISDISELDALVSEVSPKARLLMDAFWPGPLTLVFKKSDIVPLETTGGLNTVAVRYPENKVAKAFIAACGVPIAAPSANTSGKPSPTRASHVAFDMDGKIDMIIDGGSCEFGLESTIVDTTEDIPCLLRPGAVTLGMLKEVVGEVNVDKAVVARLKEGEKPKAPGMKYTHYSPKADITIVKGELSAVEAYITEKADEGKAEGHNVGIIATVQTEQSYAGHKVLVIGDRTKPETIAANLFKMLRKCDFLGFDKVYVEYFDDDELGMAIMNRLKKAAGYDIVEI